MDNIKYNDLSPGFFHIVYSRNNNIYFKVNNNICLLLGSESSGIDILYLDKDYFEGLFLQKFPSGDSFNLTIKIH